jgi:hypothetical protein
MTMENLGAAFSGESQVIWDDPINVLWFATSTPENNRVVLTAIREILEST